MRAAARLGAGRPGPGAGRTPGRPGACSSARSGRGGAPAPTSSPCRPAIELGRGSRRAAVALADSLADDRTEDAVLAHLLAGRELARTDPAAASAYLSRAAARTPPRQPAEPQHRLAGPGPGPRGARQRPRVLDAVGRGLDALAEHRATLGSPELRALTALHGADLAPAGRAARAAARAAGAGAVERPRPGGLAQPSRCRHRRTRPSTRCWRRSAACRTGSRRRTTRPRCRPWCASGPSTSGPCALAWAATPGSRRPGRPRSPTTSWSSTSATGCSCSWSTSTAPCTRWWSATDGGARVRGRADRAGDRRRSTPRCTGCAPPPAAGPVDLGRLGRPAGGGAARRRGTAAAGVVGPSSSRRRPPCSPPRGGCCRSCTTGRWRSPRRPPRGCGPAAARPLSSRAVFVVGPDLPTGGGEVAPVAGLHDGAALLTSGDATVAGTLAALDGAALGHIAAHGSFRAEAPMFSSLHLADGALTVDDVHRLAAPAAPDRAAGLPLRGGRAGRRAGRDRLRRRPARPGDRRGASPRSPTSTTPPPCR